MKVLALESSPRQKANSSILLDWIIKGIHQRGGEVVKLKVPELSITPCTACGMCYKNGECIMQDDMEKVFNFLSECRHLIVSTPVFFYHVPAQLKILIDRLQPLWARKFLLNHPMERPPSGRGLLASVGGTKGEKLFDGIILTFNCICQLLDLVMVDPILIEGVDKAGDIKRKEDKLLIKAVKAGKSLLDTTRE